MHPRGVEGAHDLLRNFANTNLIRPPTLETNKQTIWSKKQLALHNVVLELPQDKKGY